ncbi:MAG: tRNA glutamyl-Q(34) synthetase GluQRS [Alphaproteobacteria bacterium]|nr:tRNA glutamyl-Q(34) synthetase GluQRS [Alphaproteobacteria bacterium]MBO6628447.1 tRNA glutamyl-Q(34) synthetase GluQRS [Alphaproteobacteria bacterium]MDF1626110.1 tRNA glutamyl-Q(34) synthetase GluQRS [Parvibaculaceae bacterium]
MTSTTIVSPPGKPSSKPIRTRFAPSPNGQLHLGHAFSALFAANIAKKQGGQFLLRIEDIDVGRCREEYVADIYEDLQWLGLSWEMPVRRQSAHFPDYEAALKKLRALKVVYPCFATRREIEQAITDSGIGLERWPRDPDGALIYPGLYKDMASEERSHFLWEGRSYAWRLDMEKALNLATEINRGPVTFVEAEGGPNGETGQQIIQPDLFGDVIIARKDVPTSYHLAVVVDDALQGITHVTRGLDLYPATYIHRLLQILLDLPEPLYSHHRLIVDSDGRRLSKSARDKGLKDLRTAGQSPADIRRMIGL